MGMGGRRCFCICGIKHSSIRRNSNTKRNIKRNSSSRRRQR
jgi:hypothetical protein